MSSRDWWPTDAMGALADLCGVTPEAEFPHLRFRGRTYVLISEGPADQTTGPIVTYDDYAAGRASFAHLFPDGRVMRFGEQIGTRADIEWLPQPRTGR